MSKRNPQLVDKVMDYLDEVAALDNPCVRGKPLMANLAERWRYRVEDYRIICQIENGKLLITALQIAHRSMVYG